MLRQKSRWMQYAVLGTVCVLVIGGYAYMAAHSGAMESVTLNAADSYYNLLVQGFRAGQLSLKKEVPPEFAHLADPYNPTANSLYRWRYGIHDMSYYKGRLYLYFGVTPVLILFWPHVVLTGHYLFQRRAAALFCAMGFLVSVGLLHAMWRRYFAEVSVGVLAACALALGLTTFVPVLLARCEINEVAISCGYLLTMLALGGIWCALHEPKRRCRWLAAASVAYGLAVGARPSLLLGSVILLVPVAQAWRERQPLWALLVAATGPIILTALALMLYNTLRFDSPFEFGTRYQLAADYQYAGKYFSLDYLWFNLRVCFLQPARWCGRFPFVQEIAAPPLPAGHGLVDTPYGVLTCIPVVWLALAARLAWRDRSAEARAILNEFVTAVALLFGICTLTMGLFYGTCVRYEVEFLPALLLLAVAGILGLERVLAHRLVWRRTVRWIWGLLLGFSIAFNLFASVDRYAYDHDHLGNVLALTGKLDEAVDQYGRALMFKPDYAEAHVNLGNVLALTGKLDKAIDQYEQALMFKPDYADAHVNLGDSLLRVGRVQDAIDQYEQALRIQPRMADVHNNLGFALFQADEREEAIRHYEQALQIDPDFAAAHYNLGNAYLEAGKIQDAVAHYEQAVRINPDYADAHNNLAFALLKEGKIQEAIGHCEQALRVRPEYAEAHYNLGNALQQQGKIKEAIAHYQEALRLKPDFAEARNQLALLPLVP